MVTWIHMLLSFKLFAFLKYCDAGSPTHLLLPGRVLKNYRKKHTMRL